MSVWDVGVLLTIPGDSWKLWLCFFFVWELYVGERMDRWACWDGWMENRGEVELGEERRRG